MANEPKKIDWVDLYARARWDRLLAAAAAVIVLLVIIVSICRSCGKDDEKEPAGTTSIAETIPPTTEPPIDYSKAVYLSPSTQYDNLYACDGTTTEAAAMIELAKKIKDLLEADGYTVFMCGETDSVRDKVTQGNELQCGAYVALHTNSGGESGNGQGTECYYNSNMTASRQLAECIYNNVAALTPTEDRGLKDESSRDLYEIVNNVSACCLLEVEFHDIADLSQWILDHQDETAKAIADGINNYLAIAETSPSSGLIDPTAPTMEWTPDIVH
ncbi:MAG: N-acetylmuramoyl-L-alanine amidase [Oscillospiraceae bacterium]|nr:N-acetylmuramoyl-L-alanine amidase [Oscillospiraceae bacterium]